MAYCGRFKMIITLKDGKQLTFDSPLSGLEITKAISETVNIPVIASGGAGKKEHFRDTFQIGHSDAALAASVFHFGEIPIPELKDYLWGEGINVRRTL